MYVRREVAYIHYLLRSQLLFIYTYSKNKSEIIASCIVSKIEIRQVVSQTNIMNVNWPQNHIGRLRKSYKPPTIRENKALSL
jgi:hypothetical protein